MKLFNEATKVRHSRLVRLFSPYSITAKQKYTVSVFWLTVYIFFKANAIISTAVQLAVWIRTKSCKWKHRWNSSKNVLHKLKHTAQQVSRAYADIMFPQTAVFVKRFTQTTEDWHRCFQRFAAQPHLAFTTTVAGLNTSNIHIFL